MNPPPVTFSAVESARFGLKVYRGFIKDTDGKTLLEQILTEGIDVAIIRQPSGEAGAVRHLQQHGMPTIHADTLVYYSINLQNYSPAPLRNADLCFSIATADDADALHDLVSVCFSDYRCHYHANQNFAAHDILEGYLEWANAYLNTNADGRYTWVARRNGTIVAFACCSTDPHNNLSEGVLYGVHPDHAGGGLYGDLIRYTQQQFKSLGYQSMRVSTQIWNCAVQKVWAREGFYVSQSYDTYHINAMLSAGELLVDRELIFSAEQVAQFAHASGDTNPVHLDDVRAKQAGFDGRISHGMLSGSELSRIFGTEAPGPGTLYLRSDLIFTHPIYADQPHNLQIRYLRKHGSPKLRAVAIITNTSKQICLLAYNDLLTR